MLCEHCEAFDIQDFSPHGKSFQESKHGQTRDILSLKRGQDAGCAFCNLLMEHVREGLAMAESVKGKELELSIHVEANSLGGDGTQKSLQDGLRINRFFVSIRPRYVPYDVAAWHGKWPIHIERDLCVISDPASPARKAEDVVGQWLGHDLSSDHHFETISRWLHSCLTHSQCNQTLSQKRIWNIWEVPLPLRCVELLSHGKGIRLRETDGQRGAYITLSHRWTADTGRCGTTASNYNARLEGKEFPWLSQVFRDALKVTERMGVRYIWIDTLCIIQDGDGGKDWRQEAPKMSQYYQYSLLTISAAVSSPAMGIFNAKIPDKIPQKLVRLPYRDSECCQKGHFYVYERGVGLFAQYEMALQASQFPNRGWIFQEWLLSRRVIYYTDYGLFFECQAHSSKNDSQELAQPITSSQYSPKEINLHPELRWAHIDNTNSNLKVRIGLGKTPPEELWYRLIESYSFRDLTRPEEDRLIALSGIKDAFEEILQQTPGTHWSSEYIAGVWISDVHYSLLWHKEQDSLNDSKVKNLPSWSWAALIAKVRWPRRGQVIPACEISLAGQPEDYEAVSSSPQRISLNLESITSPPGPIIVPHSLQVHGKLIPVLLRQGISQSDELQPVMYITDFEETFNCENIRQVCSISNPYLVGGWGSLEALEVQERLQRSQGATVFALHVSTRKVHKSAIRLGSLWGSYDIFEVLYLDCVGEGKYCRVGVGRIYEQALLDDFSKVNKISFELV
ncbi:putative transcription factor C2H2 [Rosellinia necatrix]|uniref:Putative transcription factor C2H2 n=1 Tax=Rosellinia necatrix TaxID=77044 RepID=A0A1W2TF13_ROSNE|nr:putative transcription factor C2H2 [Rosellinia necatrix]